MTSALDRHHDGLPACYVLLGDATKGRSMSGNSESVLTELIPLALVVALSPLSVIPAVLVLHTPRPRPTSLAFLLGWLAGLTVLTVLFLELSTLVAGLGK